jgi:hypothetical protein
MMLDEEEFWSLIDRSRAVLSGKGRDGNQERQARELTRLLVLSGRDTALGFAQRAVLCHHELYDWRIWAAAYVLLGGCSDDAFFDFRCWVISMGRRAYEAALENPDSLVVPARDGTVEALVFEGFLDVPDNAYRAITGRKFPANTFPLHPKVPRGRRWVGDSELASKLPRLTSMFGPDQEQ